MSEDEELKKILGRMGIIMKRMEKSVNSIKYIQTFFLVVFIIEFIISFYIGWMYGISL